MIIRHLIGSQNVTALPVERNAYLSYASLRAPIAGPHQKAGRQVTDLVAVT